MFGLCLFKIVDVFEKYNTSIYDKKIKLKNKTDKYQSVLKAPLFFELKV